MRKSQHLRPTDWDAWNEAAELLRILALTHRLRMVHMLLQGGFTGSGQAKASGVPSSLVSEHLRMIQGCVFLPNEQNGRNVLNRVAVPVSWYYLQCDEHGLIYQHERNFLPNRSTASDISIN